MVETPNKIYPVTLRTWVQMVDALIKIYPVTLRKPGIHVVQALNKIYPVTLRTWASPFPISCDIKNLGIPVPDMCDM